jgi:uncharacterized RDD family membrane protein YckC
MSYTPSPAGFWKRYVAYFVDIVILYIAVEILSLLYFSFQAQSELSLLMDLLNSLKAEQASGEIPDPYVLMQKMESLLLPALLFSTITYFILGGIYFSVMESSRQQATVGKRMLGIKVTNANGEPIRLPQAIARYCAASLSWISLNLGHALAAWTPGRRALHDYIASTRVENVDPKNPGMPLWGWVVVIAHGLFFVGSCAFMVLMVWLMMQQIAAI